MPSPTEITVAKLSRLVGLPHCPAIVDVRTDDDYERDPRLLPGSVRRPGQDLAQWARKNLGGRSAIIVCQKGAKLSQGAAAWLRHEGIAAETLEGGFEAWKADKQILVSTKVLPKADAEGRTVWVTRARPKIDRIACPWLIRRFVDPNAVFLFVSASEVLSVAERFAATPFDIDGVFWSHRGERCTFDIMVEEFGLDLPALHHVAMIVRGADTSRHDLAPEAAGLLAISLGLSRMHRDDLEQLKVGMTVYDALYRWARDATEETHNWPANQPAR